MVKLDAQEQLTIGNLQPGKRLALTWLASFDSIFSVAAGLREVKVDFLAQVFNGVRWIFQIFDNYEVGVENLTLGHLEVSTITRDLHHILEFDNAAIRDLEGCCRVKGILHCKFDKMWLVLVRPVEGLSILR